MPATGRSFIVYHLFVSFPNPSKPVHPYTKGPFKKAFIILDESFCGAHWVINFCLSDSLTLRIWRRLGPKNLSSAPDGPGPGIGWYYYVVGVGHPASFRGRACLLLRTQYYLFLVYSVVAHIDRVSTFCLPQSNLHKNLHTLTCCAHTRLITDGMGQRHQASKTLLKQPAPAAQTAGIHRIIQHIQHEQHVLGPSTLHYYGRLFPESKPFSLFSCFPVFVSCFQFFLSVRIAQNTTRAVTTYQGQTETTPPR